MDKFDFMSLEEPVEDTPKEEPAEELVENLEQEEEFEEVEEGEIEEKEEEVPVKKKEPYTAEEIQEILKADGEVDTERLSPAEQATMKAMQRAFTPKLQEAADLRREVENMRKSLEDSKPKAEPKDIYEAYEQDPDGVLQYLDSQAEALVAENKPENMAQIRQLDSLKHEFNRRDMQKVRDANVTQNTQAGHMQAILQAVPDLAEKQGKLKEFALTMLGYTEQELAQETNPSVAGAGAARAIARINTAYDKAQAKVTVKRKRVKKATNVEKPSSGGFETPTPDNVKDAKDAGMKSGNFKDFFAALEED